ncbi:metallophosphoesterase [Methylobacterium sp. J-078]|uniref:metallophosphoesterase family protein n=1 Tax=Methylobacterium sp. J-078 TaxID=2836657 RepID=UPI001FBBE775|nr:metallophosphoesterase [Methylobacterium sp. J-078]MCJ2044481.1 metallophosphoesterase [Methylobacterium sp. J-078]
MATPAIALRFRDTTPGVDTITEHRAVLARNGLVGWGWWKKTFETDQCDGIMQLLATSGKIDIIIMDRTTERAFYCCCIAFNKPSEADASAVPAYYKDHLGLTAGVFSLLTIDDMPFDITLGNSIGDETFLWINSKADSTHGHIEVPADAPGRSCVLHLSDLHFGGDYGFRRQKEDVDLGDPRKTLTDCLMSDLERLGLTKSIAAMIVTGDFMTHGKFDEQHRKAALAEFEALRERLELSPEQIIPLPGNHDVVRYPEGTKINVRENAVEVQVRYDHETPFRTFVDELTGRDWKASLNYTRRIRLGETDLDVCVVNSCTIAPTEWTEYGYVGRNGLDAIIELGEQAVDRPTFRFLALHHHLLPVVNVEALKSKGVTLTIDAADILTACQMSGVHVALHGHQHKPKVAMYQSLGLNGEQTNGPIYVVSNGSAGAKNARLPAGERNTYCLFQLKSANIDLWIRELRLDGQAGATIFNGSLTTQPIDP